MTAREEAAVMAHLIPRTDEQLSVEIAALESLSAAQLRDRWKDLYGTEPPPRASRDLLMRTVAYRIQGRALGRPVLSLQVCRMRPTLAHIGLRYRGWKKTSILTRVRLNPLAHYYEVPAAVPSGTRRPRRAQRRGEVSSSRLYPRREDYASWARRALRELDVGFTGAR